MTSSVSSPLRWLRSDEPTTRAQARMGAVYRLLQRLLRSPIGVAGLLILLVIVAITLAAPWLPLQNYIAQSLGDRLLPPSAQHWFGTDTMGRDLLARDRKSVV